MLPCGKQMVFKVLWMFFCAQTNCEILKSVMELRMTGLDYDSAGDSCQPGHLVDLREPRGYSVVKMLEPYGHSGALVSSDRIWTGVSRLEGEVFQWYDNETITQLTIGPIDYSSALSLPLAEDCVLLHYDNNQKTFRLHIEFCDKPLFTLCQTELGVSCDYLSVGNMFVEPSGDYTYQDISGVPSPSECENLCTNLSASSSDECWMAAYKAGSQSCRLITGETMLTWAVTCDWFAYDSAWEASKRICFELTVFDENDHQIILEPCILPSPPPVPEISSSIEEFSTQPYTEIQNLSETLSPLLMAVSTLSVIESQASSAVDIQITPSVSYLPATSCVGVCSIPRSSVFYYPVTSLDLVIPTSAIEVLLTSWMYQTINPSADNLIPVASPDVTASTPSPVDVPVTSLRYQMENSPADNPLLVMSSDIAVPTPSSVDASMTSLVYHTENLSAHNLFVISLSHATVTTASPFDLPVTSSTYPRLTPLSDIHHQVMSTNLAVLAASSTATSDSSFTVTSPDFAVPSPSHFDLPVTSSSYEVISPSADVYLKVPSSDLTTQIMPSTSEFAVPGRSLAPDFLVTSLIVDNLHTPSRTTLAISPTTSEEYGMVSSQPVYPITRVDQSQLGYNFTAAYYDHTNQSESTPVLNKILDTPLAEPTTLTAVVSYSNTRKSCNKTCFCQRKGSLDKNESLMSQILERLSIDTKNTSAYRRHHTSATDQRVLSVSMGWGGICLISLLGALILLSDAPILVHDSFNAFHNIKSIFVHSLKYK